MNEPTEKPKRRRRDGERRSARSPTVGEVREHLIRQYQENQHWDIRAADARAEEGVRRRKDGSPSAHPPQAVVPLAFWATVLPEPDGGDYDDTPSRLAVYKGWLRMWRAKGLYDGPVELTYEGEDAPRRDDDESY